MKHTTSSWFTTLTLREMKDLVCLLFEVDAKFRQHRHRGLLMELLKRLDDEYHESKQGSPKLAPTSWSRLLAS